MQVKLSQATRQSHRLMTLSENGEWEAFLVVFADYIAALGEVLLCQGDVLRQEEAACVRQEVERLLENDLKIQQQIRKQQDVLRQKMAMLNKGKAVSHAYAAPFSAGR